MQVSLARQERPCETLSGNFISKKCVSLFEKERESVAWERVWAGLYLQCFGIGVIMR